MINYAPFIWPSDPPQDIPFPKSDVFVGLELLGISTRYEVGDTWFPSWASDGQMYSPFTDGCSDDVCSNSSAFTHDGVPDPAEQWLIRKAATGNAVITGSDPLNLRIKALGIEHADPFPYGGRYPCGSLVVDGIWYYGTYCLSPYGSTRYGNFVYNWPWLGPFVGFRISQDFGRTWLDCPHTPQKPLFGESGLGGYPVKIGAPHFVDFGKNMEHSPDGKAYLVAQGSDLKFYPAANFAHLSWITGDQVYLIRVTPSITTINDPQAYEFFAGYDSKQQPLWSNQLADIKPLLEWQNNMGCVTVTFNAPLQKYLMVVTDGVNTCTKMNTYILEADAITGPWRLITYMKDFGQQAYFVTLPSKFIADDGLTLWMSYSGNFSATWEGVELQENPPGSQGGLVLQKVRLISRTNK